MPKAYKTLRALQGSVGCAATKPWLEHLWKWFTRRFVGQLPICSRLPFRVRSLKLQRLCFGIAQPPSVPALYVFACMKPTKFGKQFSIIFDLAVRLADVSEADALLILVDAPTEWDKLKDSANGQRIIIAADASEQMEVPPRLSWIPSR